MKKKAALIFTVFCAVGMAAQNRFTALESALQNEGFANIRTVEKDSTLILTLQNEAYKLHASGIAAAIKVLEKQGALDGRSVEMIVTDYDVPQATLRYSPATGNWDVSHRLDRKDWKLVRSSPVINSDFGKIDINIYPQVSLMNLIITQVYQSLWQLSPELSVSLWPGMKLSAQLKIPIYNDGYGARESKVHPGMITFSQRFRLPGDIMGRFSAGVFHNNRHGLALELKRRFSLAPWAWMEGHFAMLGLCYYDGFTLHYDNQVEPFWSIGGGMYWPLLETAFSMKVERFLLNDYGIKAEMTRHFRYCSIGFYAEKGLNTYAKSNGGFRFQIALPPYRMKRWKASGYIPRINTSGQMGMTYNANNEQRWYKETRFEASDNIMNDNSFNPYFIKKEIEKLKL